MVKTDLKETIEIPSDIDKEITEEKLILKKQDKELSRKLDNLIKTKIENETIILEAKKATKRERKIFGTMKAHIKNMIKGLNENYKYKLEIANVHFPMNVSFDEGKNILIIKNFLGEKSDRTINIRKGVTIKVDKNIIEVESHNKELAGQVSADIEKGTRVRKKDRRIYQDGIYIIEKPKRLM